MSSFNFLCTVGRIYIRDISGQAAVTSCYNAENNSIHVLELFPTAELQIHIPPEILFLHFIPRCLRVTP